MGLNIKNSTVENLASEVAQMTGETKTQAIRRALEERRERLSAAGWVQARTFQDAVSTLEREIWSDIPNELLGGGPLNKKAKERILGYGPDGV